MLSIPFRIQEEFDRSLALILAQIYFQFLLGFKISGRDDKGRKYKLNFQFLLGFKVKRHSSHYFRPRYYLSIPFRIQGGSDVSIGNCYPLDLSIPFRIQEPEITPVHHKQYRDLSIPFRIQGNIYSRT